MLRTACTLQAPLAAAVLNKVQPSASQLRTQGTGKTVVSTLRTDAQKQAARLGRDQEAATAAARGRRKNSASGKRKQATAQQQPKQTRRLRQKTVITDDTGSDEADAELLDDMEGSEDISDGADDEAGPSTRVSQRARKASGWQAQYAQ